MTAGLGGRFLLVLICASAPACGGGEVLLAVPLSMQPYFIAESDKGLAYETIVAAYRASGRNIVPVYISEREHAGVFARHPHVDCAAFQPGVESEGLFAIDDVYGFHDYAVTLTSNHIQLNDVRDLKDKKIIAYLGSRDHLGDEYRAVVDEDPHYREIYNHRAQVRLLLRNQVQVIIADRLLVNWYARYLTQESGEPVELTYHNLFPPGESKFICRRRESLEDFTTGLEAIRRSGELEKIRSRYFQ